MCTFVSGTDASLWQRPDDLRYGKRQGVPRFRIDAVPEFTYRITRTRKVSGECYVHYNANRYSVPWKYAGRESTVTEESGILKIKIGDEIIEHGILQGSGRISRKKEHFEGLLKSVSDRNAWNYGIEVEKRDLKNYEVA